MDKVVVVGLGYIGLPTAAALATRGVRVVGIDVNTAVIESINAGSAHLAEPDLAVAVSGAVAMGRLRATDTPVEANAFVIAVPTPARADHTADVSYIRSAAVAIAPVLRPGN